MFAIIAKILSGSLLDGIFDVAKAYLNKEISREEAAAKIVGMLGPAIVEGLKQQGAAVLAELNSESWFVRSWRAMVGFSAWFVVMWYALATPILVAWFGMPAPRVGDALLEWVYTMATIAVGGYVGGPILQNMTNSIVGYLKSRR